MASFEVIQQARGDICDAEYNQDQLESYDEITLEQVDGVSYASKNAISSNPFNGHIALAASSVLVFFDPKYVEQAFIENPSSREITAVSFSSDGRYVAYGENGINPFISVYGTKQFTQINRFKIDGKCSVKTLQFHPRSIYLVVIPVCDYSILIYDFVRGLKLAATKLCVEPLAMTMTKLDSILAVCGHRKIMCFSMTNIDTNSYEINAMLDKRAILLGKYGNYTFVDITVGQDIYVRRIYLVTSCGYLCEIQSGDIVINQVSKISERCFCTKFELSVLFVGCDGGMVKICNPEDLTVAAVVCDDHMFGPDQLIQPMSWIVKSDILAITVNATTNIITTLLSDQKRHSWQITFCNDAVECSPVIPFDSNNKSCSASKFVTSHDMHCNLAQLLLNRSSKSKEYSFMHRPSMSRCRQVNAIRITPDGKAIISGNKLGEIKVYEATTGILQKVIEAHNAAITCIELMYDDDFKLVVSGGRDRIIFILNAGKDYQFLQAIHDHSSAIISISLVYNNGVLTLVSSSADGTILIRRAPKGETLTFVTVGELPECVGSKKRVYNHSNGYIITGQERGRINLFPAHPFMRLKPMKKLKVGDMILKTVATDPTGSFFVAYSSAGQYVFHLQTGREIATLCALPGFYHLSFSQDLSYLINSNDSGCKFLWRLPKKMVDVMQNKISNSGDKEITSPREFSYTSYMSCVRVCQELAEDEPHLTSDHSQGVRQRACLRDKQTIHRIRLAEGATIGALDPLSVDESDSYMSCTTYSSSLTSVCQSEDSDSNSELTLLMKSKSCSALDVSIVDNKELCDSDSLARIPEPVSEIGETNDSGKSRSFVISKGRCDGERECGENGAQVESVWSQHSHVKHTQNSSSLPWISETDDTLTPSSSSTKIMSASSIHSDASLLKQQTDAKHPDGLKECKDGDADADADGDKKTISSGPFCHVKDPQFQMGPLSKGNDIERTTLMRDDEFNSTKSTGGVVLSGVLDEIPLPDKDDTALSTVTEGNMENSVCSKNPSGGENVMESEGDTTSWRTIKTVAESDPHFAPPRQEDTLPIRYFNPPRDAAVQPALLESLSKNGLDPKQVCCRVDELDHMNVGELNESKSVMSSYSSCDHLESSLHSTLESEGRLEGYYNEFCRCMQLSNSQETYLLKDVERNDLLNEMQHSVAKGEDHRNDKACDSGAANLVRLKDAFNESSDSPKDARLPCLRPKLDAEVGENDNAEYYSSLRRVFFRWVKMKMRRERMKKLKSVKTCEKNMPREKFESKDLGTMTTSDLTSSEEIVKQVVSATSNCDAVTDVGASAGEETFDITKSWERPVRYPSTIKERSETSSWTESQNKQTAPTLSTTTSGPFATGGPLVKDKLGTIGSSNDRYPLTSNFIQRLDKPLSIEEPYNSKSRTDNTSNSPATSSVLDRIGGVAELFRNQDDYLRKLKEVRRNFEKSIQALSAERRSQQMEAQRYFMNE